MGLDSFDREDIEHEIEEVEDFVIDDFDMDDVDELRPEEIDRLIEESWDKDDFEGTYLLCLQAIDNNVRTVEVFEKLGLLYLNDLYIEKNEQEALRYLSEASKLGSELATEIIDRFEQQGHLDSFGINGFEMDDVDEADIKKPHRPKMSWRDSLKTNDWKGAPGFEDFDMDEVYGIDDPETEEIEDFDMDKVNGVDDPETEEIEDFDMDEVDEVVADQKSISTTDVKPPKAKSTLEKAQENLRKAQEALKIAEENEDDYGILDAEAEIAVYTYAEKKARLEQSIAEEHTVAQGYYEKGDGIAVSDSLRRIARTQFELECSRLEKEISKAVYESGMLAYEIPSLAGNEELLKDNNTEIRRYDRRAAALREQLNNLRQNRKLFIQQRTGELKKEFSSEKRTIFPNAARDIQDIAEGQISRNMQEVTTAVKGYYK